MSIKDSKDTPLAIGDAVTYADVSGLPYGIIQFLGPGHNLKVKFPGLPILGTVGRRVVKASGPICRDCSFALEEIPWNSKVNLYICNNWKCPQYSRPQGRKSISEKDVRLPVWDSAEKLGV